MNKRQRKKLNKRIEESLSWGMNHLASYRELKELERSYHEYCVQCKRHEKIHGKSNWIDEL